MTWEQLVAPQPKLVRITLGPVSNDPRQSRAGHCLEMLIWTALALS
jgi:hypothetical protein